MSIASENDGRVAIGGLEGEASGPASRTTILVNRRLVEVDGTEANHAQLVALAHPGVVTAETRAFTVAFSRGAPSRPEGFVAPGDRVDVVDRQEFHVAVADRS